MKGSDATNSDLNSVTASNPSPRTAAGWYSTELSPRPARVPLAGAHSADVVVVGGGLAGLSVAHGLARRGVKVVVLEAERVGFGASGRNGGSVSPGFANGLDAIERQVGRAAADKLFRLSLEGVEIVRRNLAEFAGPALRGRGVLTVRRVADPDGVAAAHRSMAERFNRRLSVLPTIETRKLARSSRYFDALLDESSFHIQPLIYVESVAGEIERLGGRICEGSRVVGLRQVSGEAVRLATATGEIGCRHVVLATSAYDRSLQPRISRAIQSIATYMLATAPLGELSRAAIATEAAIGDDRRAGDYYRNLADGRILWGGRITTRTSEPARLANLLKSDMLSVYPQLGDPPIAAAWSGLMAYARHKMPLVGRLSATTWVSTAFGGHGLNTTAAAGEVIAAAIAEGDDRYRLFDCYTAGWAGGIAGKAVVQLTYWAMQARDRFDERKALAGNRSSPVR